MNQAVFTNSALLKYWNTTRGGNKTQLSISEVMQLGLTVKCIDIYPVQGSGVQALHLNDGYIDLNINGNLYTSFPDFINDSFGSFSEQKDISNDSMSFKVSNVSQSFQVLALSGGLKNAQVNMWLTILNPADATVLDNSLIYSGYLDYFESISNNDDLKNELTVYVNSIWKKLDVQQRTLAANSVHQSTHKNDAYFSLLGKINSQQTWKYKK
ncbi:DUF2163 domain-containing protein [Leclercia sp.]|uniref:DUF2163 domain-containing protein n=1 Tax=Leclercia sp. TaxID=1898428 RepID=UPI002FDD01F5